MNNFLLNIAESKLNSGMLAPAAQIEDLLGSIRTGKTTSLEKVSDRLREINDNYAKWSWSWCADLIRSRTGTDVSSITPEQFGDLVTDWKEKAVKLNNLILKDAEKEFDVLSKIGFGIDGDDEIRERDFAAVRGSYDDNVFILETRAESDAVTKRADELLALVGQA